MLKYAVFAILALGACGRPAPAPIIAQASPIAPEPARPFQPGETEIIGKYTGERTGIFVGTLPTGRQYRRVSGADSNRVFSFCNGNEELQVQNSEIGDDKIYICVKDDVIFVALGSPLHTGRGSRNVSLQLSPDLDPEWLSVHGHDWLGRRGSISIDGRTFRTMVAFSKVPNFKAAGHAILTGQRVTARGQKWPWGGWERTTDVSGLRTIIAQYAAYIRAK